MPTPLESLAKRIVAGVYESRWERDMLKFITGVLREADDIGGCT